METDVLIVGAGPSGAVTALRLAQEGFRVTVLEQGDWPDYSKANTASPEFAVTADRDWGWDPNLRAAPGDYPIDESESDITALMWNGVGGGTVVYAAQWQRNMPSDFRVRSLDGVADDWPLTYEDLEPYYVRVEKDFGISGLAGDTAFPPGEGPPLPPVPLGAMGRKVAKAHNELGWHWWPAPLAIATRHYGALNPCVQRATCLNACADGAKASVDRTHWPKAIALGVELITHARVRTLTTRPDGLVAGAIYLDADGHEHEVKATATVLCANGIGTPRLLLLSAPDGLANSSGMVGKRLMMHPFGTVVGLFEDDLGSTQGPWGQHLHCLEFYETDTSRGFVRGAKWGLQPTGGPTKMTTAYPWGAENAIWGAGFHENVRKRLGHSAMWGIIAEDLPEEHNLVTLDPVNTDRQGVPAAKIVYRMNQNSYDLMHFHEARAKESLEAAGAYETTIAPFIRATGWHLLGTCRMGDDPATSVVDGFGRSHDIPNLFIFDGSTWPTSSGMNPTATIAAMALRSAEHLIESRRELAVAA
jgi:choline dehydrogenase-like flavoprotein